MKAKDYDKNQYWKGDLAYLLFREGLKDKFGWAKTLLKKWSGVCWNTHKQQGNQSDSIILNKHGHSYFSVENK